MIKKLGLITLIFTLIGIASVNQALAQTENDSTQLPQAIFINHVRGNECCSQGSLTTLQNQIQTFQKYKLPAYFALRYDALTNPSYQPTLKRLAQDPNLHPAVMLEITPQLAADAGVEYSGSPETWYLAQQAFLIGYTPEDRIKLVDQLFKKYHQVFGEYPQLTTAWMSDTPTLNYLHQKYGVIAHQLAREQWGLDSYTLDGGPPHYPYLASPNWIFNPDFSDPNHLLIVRHTVDDPLYTYGDKTSSFTSQPNDYDIDHKDFEYFKKLVNQTLFDQAQPGFINLGLETSMAQNYQAEYQRQIEYLAQLVAAGKVTTPDLQQLKNYYATQPVTVRHGSDLINNQNQQVWWITTPRYRARVRQDGATLAITDLRVYDPEFTDPYANYQAVSQGFFNLPYLINAGLNYPGATTASRAQQWLGIPAISTFEAQPVYDLSFQEDYLTLSQNTAALTTTKDAQEIKLTDATHQQLLDFTEDSFALQNFSNSELNLTSNLPASHPLKTGRNQITWQTDDGDLAQVTWQNRNQQLEFTFKTQPQLLALARETQYPFIFPEPKPRNVDQNQSQVYVHNRYAVAGRNPVRVILVPKDEYGFPTQPQTEPQISGNPAPDLIYQRPESKNQTIKYVDISNRDPLATQLELDLDGVKLSTQIYFAPNCKTQAQYCLTHPRQAWWYLKSFIQDKARLKLLGEDQS